MAIHQDYWDHFYANSASRAVAGDPSPFARWVGRQLDRSSAVIDVGTGTGRDALWFAGQAFEVTGLDYSPASVALARRNASRRGLSVTFNQLDLYDATAVAEVAATLDRRPTAVYARFVLHALEADGRANLFDFARRAGAPGGRLYCEFRTGKDAEADHVFGDHFRLFLDPDAVVDELVELGGVVLDRDEGLGLAPYGTEDPHVARLVVGWPSGS